jgi:hypothetical protein
MVASTQNFAKEKGLQYRNYNTANIWTKAGGVQPEDWPEWMRRFRDY